MSDNKFEGLSSVRAERRRRLEAGETSPKSPPTPDIPVVEVPPNKGRAKIGKRSNPDYTLVSALIKIDLYNEVVLELMRRGRKREYSDLVGSLLEEWLKQQKSA